MSSTTTRPPRTPGALVADAVADLQDAAARLAQVAADGAFAEVPVAAMPGLTETMHRALDRGAAAATVATGVVHSSGVLAVDGFASTKAWLQGPYRKSETESKVLLASSTALRNDYAATADAWLAGEVSGGAVTVLPQQPARTGSRRRLPHPRPPRSRRGDGGTTDISNAVLLCVQHHHAVHEGGWTISRTAGVDPHTTGCWTFTPPRTRP